MLELRGVDLSFNRGSSSEVRALRGVDLSMDDGEFLVVLGQNGSGKSTLLNTIAGRYLPDAGSIALAGLAITSWPEHRRARSIGRVFQDPFTGTVASMSIAENFALASRRGKRRGLRSAVTDALREEIIARVRLLGLGLETRIDAPIGLLSGGQRQALTLLMATWRKPELLLLDEHTSALDPKSAELVIRLTRQIIETEKITTMMVTHSMQEATFLGDRLIMMQRGSIAHDIRGAEKRRLRPHELTGWFEELRQIEQLDESAADVLKRTYV